MREFQRQMEGKIEAMEKMMGNGERLPRKKRDTSEEESETTIKWNMVNGSLSPIYNKADKKFSNLSVGSLL